MAVAFMANAQHLVYRKDILDKLNISVPKTYEEMLRLQKKFVNLVLQKIQCGWGL